MHIRRAIWHLFASALIVNASLWGTSAAYQKWIAKPRIHAQELARLHAQEEELRRNLVLLRGLIRLYTADHKLPPANLRHLVGSGYIDELPRDPITGTAATWRAIRAPLGDSCWSGSGIVDVRSGSDAIDSSGIRLYSEW